VFRASTTGEALGGFAPPVSVGPDGTVGEALVIMLTQGFRGQRVLVGV
jgi:hypothetical protein